MISTAQLTRSLVIGGIALVALGLPARASAQSDRLVRTIADFRTALRGVYGDEGRDLTGFLDQMRRDLSSSASAARTTEASLREGLHGASGDVAARLYLQLGWSLVQRHQFADALDAFDAAADLASDDPALHLVRGLVLDQLERHEEASRAFDRAFARERSNPVAAYLMIETAPPESNLDPALQTLQSLARDVTRGAVGRASAPFANLAVFPNSSGSNPVFAPARYAAGFALYGRGDHQAGLDRLREAAAHDPLIVDPAAGSEEMGAASSALRQRDVGAALASLEDLRARLPESSETHRLLSVVYGITGPYAKSVDHAETALRLRPDDERTWIALARLQGRRGDDAAAMRTLERATQALPESGELHWMLASLAHRLERTDEALAAYDAAARAVGIAGRHDLLRSVAYLADHHQDLSRAIDVTQARVRISRNDAVAHRELAALYTKDGRHARAFAQLAVAAWLEPDDPRTFVALGQTQMALGRHDHAVEALQRAVALEPRLPEGRYRLAQALVRTGRRADSREHLAEFQRLSAITQELERQVRRIATVRRTAALHALDGSYELATEAYETLVALQPESAQNYLDLAQALQKAGRLEDSLEALTIAATLDGGPEVHRRLAEVLSRLGRSDESDEARERYESLWLQDMERRGRT